MTDLVTAINSITTITAATIFDTPTFKEFEQKIQREK
jgi:hypothetical protein